MDTQEMKVGGYFSFELVRDGEIIDRWEEHNIVTNAGLNYVLDAALSAGTVNTNHYVGLFSNNYTPIATTVITNLTEITTAYNETTRPAWSEAGVTSQTITNSATPAAFTFNTTATAYGAFLISNNTKGGTTGTLVSATLFAASRSLIANDVLNVTYTVTAASS